MLVRRKVPVRFGIVPLVHNQNALEQAKVVHHLFDTYGIGASIAYLRAVSLPIPEFVYEFRIDIPT